jgi:hypothetical protein
MCVLAPPSTRDDVKFWKCVDARYNDGAVSTSTEEEVTCARPGCVAARSTDPRTTAAVEVGDRPEEPRENVLPV